MDTARIAEQIKNMHNPNHTLVVGIDGLGGAGKSTVSQEISKLLETDGCNVAILHIDDFIQPRAVRYNDEHPEWECYYVLQWRYDYLLREILTPIRSGMAFDGDIELYDKDNDTYCLTPTSIPVGSIVIIEGVFLQRKELSGIFDYMIYIDIPESTRLERVLERDGYIGDREQIKAKYDNRYFPAERHYITSCAPRENADYVITL